MRSAAQEEIKQIGNEQSRSHIVTEDTNFDAPEEQVGSLAVGDL